MVTKPCKHLHQSVGREWNDAKVHERKQRSWSFNGKANSKFLSVNDPCSNAPTTHKLSPESPAERKLLHMHGSQYVRTYLLGRSSRVSSTKGRYGRQEESKCILQSHSRLTSCQENTVNTEKRSAPLCDFARFVLTGQWSGGCLLAQPDIDVHGFRSGKHISSQGGGGLPARGLFGNFGTFQIVSNEIFVSVSELMQKEYKGHMYSCEL